MFLKKILRPSPLRRLGAFLFVSALFLASTCALAAETGGEQAKTFKSFDYNNNEFSLDPYLGKVPIVLDFGSIYCSSCVQSIPHMIVLQEKYGKDIRIVGVNLDTSGLSRVKKFFSAFSATLNFPILLDKSLSIANQFNVVQLPTYIVIDKSGKVVSTIIGYDDENRAKMDAVIEKVVKGQAVTAQEAKMGQEVTIYSPVNFTMTYQSYMWVVGKTNGNKGPFTVKLNGGSPRTAKISGDTFSVRIPLCYGSNFIEVDYPKGEGIGTQAVVLFRDPRMGEGLGANFPEYKFHLPEREKNCVGCHEMEPNAEEAQAGMSTSCQLCHGYQTEEKFVHGPIPVGGCPACHDFKSKPHRYTLTAEGSALCFTCHADVKAKFEKSAVHGPVAMGLCVVCHNPHSAPFKFQLRSSQSSLCLSCHEDMRPKVNKTYIHKPITQDTCTGCHEPHASDSQNLFLKGDGQKLCDLCHTAQQMSNHSHQKSGIPPVKMPGLPLDAKGLLACKSCHDPHSSDEVKLTFFKGGCDGCHAAVKKAKAPPPPPVDPNNPEGAAPVAPGAPGAPAEGEGEGAAPVAPTEELPWWAK